MKDILTVEFKVEVQGYSKTWFQIQADIEGVEI